jgi:hypothetical protein
MERELWPVLYHAIKTVAEGFKQKYVSYQPWVLVMVTLWAALHDRPVSWACEFKNWQTTRLRPVRLPSPSTLSRRSYKVGTGLFWRALEQYLRQTAEPGLLAYLDGKPLPIGGYSTDPDARRGRGADGMAKGYKLHTLWSNRPLPEAWEVTPLNTAETKVAEQLFAQAPGAGYVLADGNYDSSKLFDQAHQAGYQLVVPLPKENAGQGHHYQSPYRKHGIAMMQRPFGRDLYRLRGQIERSFGNATTFAGGLMPLPAWVRRLYRVRIWVWAKLLINAARIIKNQGLMARLQ